MWEYILSTTSYTTNLSVRKNSHSNWTCSTLFPSPLDLHDHYHYLDRLFLFLLFQAVPLLDRWYRTRLKHKVTPMSISLGFVLGILSHETFGETSDTWPIWWPSRTSLIRNYQSFLKLARVLELLTTQLKNSSLVNSSHHTTWTDKTSLTWSHQQKLTPPVLTLSL